MTAPPSVVAGLVLLAMVAGGARAETGSQLEQRSRSFYELLERGERDRAAATWPELERALAAHAEELRSRLDRMRDEVIERDGDLDELYRSPRWREPEIESLVVAYHLAWVRYQGAQLVGDPSRKKSLLKQSIDGFSQFLLVNDVPEIYAESLYGRGLAFLDLGETGKAIEDLQAAAEEPRTAGRAKAALEEARRRAGGRKEENDPEALLARLGDLLGRAAAGDATTERDATTLARGLAVRGGAWPARVRSLIADKLGGGATSGVRSTWALFLLAQLAVDQNRCADVAPLAEASAGIQDAGRARWRPELLYLDAGCKLNGGRAREAAEEFAALAHEHPDSPHARDAAYYRFRALDVAREKDPTLAAAYEEALTSYLGRWSNADGAAEARYLLAELYRARGDCVRAAAAYAPVRGGPFAARARLGDLECRVSTLPGGGGPARGEVVTAIRAFVRDTPARGPDELTVARAALLGAAVASASTPPDHAAAVELLEQFEQHYPAARDLHSRALELRLRARVGTGQLAAARHDLDTFLARGGDAEERRRVLDQLGRDLAARAERGAPEERAAALDLARPVYATLVRERGAAADRIMLAEVELRAGNAPAARRLYEEVLRTDGGSAEALRGAARAAAAAGDREGALGYWRQVVEGSPSGGTAWYEARLAQVTLLSEDGRRAQACEVVRSSRGRAISAGADQLAARLQALEPHVCR